MTGRLPDFTDEFAAAEWFRSNSLVCSTIMASRAALRLLPLSVFELELAPERLRSETLPAIFRGVSLGWTAHRFFKDGEVAMNTAARVCAAADNARTADKIADLAVGAAFWAAHSVEAALRSDAEAASRAAATATTLKAAERSLTSALSSQFPGYLDPAANIDSRVPNEVLKKFAHAAAIDAVSVSNSQSHDSVSNFRIWPTDTPDALNTFWSRIKSDLTGHRDEHWQVWIDWYEARLRGDPPDWERERAHVLDLEEFWDEGPAAANAEIARRLAEIDARRRREAEEKAAADPAPLDPDAAAAAERARLGDFALDPATGEYRLVPPPEETPDLSAPPIRRGFANRVRDLADRFEDLADDLQADGVNVRGGLLRDLRRYAETARREPMEAINPSRLVSLGNDLRRTWADPDVAGAMGDLHAAKLGAALTDHERLMGDFYAPAVARVEAIDPVPADPEADLVAIAEIAAAAPDHLPPDAPRLAAADRRLLAQMAEEVRAKVEGAQFLEADLREAATRAAVVETKQLGATAWILLRPHAPAVLQSVAGSALWQFLLTALRALFGV